MNVKSVTGSALFTPTVPVQQPLRLALSVNEAAQAIGIGATVMWRYIASGRCRSFRVGRSRRVLVADLEAFVAELAEAS